MTMVLERVLADGKVLPQETMQGRRSKPMPPAPDLASLKYGDPIQLFNGESLDGWSLTNPKDNNAWSAKDGTLVNNPQLEEGTEARQFGNIRTEREFEDFRLQLELRLPKGGNSGIYLRGRYEVQVTDNQFLEGCTGGALSSDDEKPGPIYFQGDHTSVEYRNIFLTPRIKP